MPYCEPCEKYHAPTTLTESGECPDCGTDLHPADEDGETSDGAPWHFKLLIAVTVVYLGYRAIQGIMWLL